MSFPILPNANKNYGKVFPKVPNLPHWKMMQKEDNI